MTKNLSTNTSDTNTPDTIVATDSFSDLVALMARLRQDCPWDKKQTNHSLIGYAIEETYELIGAILVGDTDDIKSELGDVLLQVVFHACLYHEQGKFDINDVIFTLQDKLIRRHPHVFGAENLSTDTDVKRRWDEIKQAENAQKDKPRRTLIAKSSTALLQADDIQKQASKVGFDWQTLDGAWSKCHEEIAELQALLPTKDNPISNIDKTKITEELGDCLFALVNIARKLDINSEVALLMSVAKFKERFDFIEDTLAKTGKTVHDSTLDEMDRLWDMAKTLQKSP